MINLPLAIIDSLVAAAVGLTAPQPKEHSEDQAGVRSELTGQVFIATRGGESIKLGSIEVSAIAETDMISFIRGREALIAPTKASLERALEQRKLERTAAEKAYDKAKADMDASRPGDKRTKLISAWVEAGTIEAVASGVQTSAEKRLWSFPTAEFFYDGLPKGVSKTITDADGKFSLVLGKRKYAVAAHATRELGSETVAGIKLPTTEEYYWLVWLTISDVPSQRLLLTNNNLITSKSQDSVFAASKPSFTSSN